MKIHLDRTLVSNTTSPPLHPRRRRGGGQGGGGARVRDHPLLRDRGEAEEDQADEKQAGT